MGALLGLVALLLVPILLMGLVLGLLGAVLKVGFVLLTLPLRIVAGLLKGIFGLVAGLLGGLFGLAMGGAGLLVGLLALVAVFVLLPLAPLLLIGAVVWLGVKAFSPAVRVV